MVIGQVEWTLSKNHIFHSTSFFELNYIVFSLRALENNESFRENISKQLVIFSVFWRFHSRLIWEKMNVESLLGVVLNHLQFLIIFIFSFIFEQEMKRGRDELARFSIVQQSNVLKNQEKIKACSTMIGENLTIVNLWASLNSDWTFLVSRWNFKQNSTLFMILIHFFYLSRNYL